MAKNKGHKNLIPCKKGESGNPNGRPRKFHSQIIAELKEQGAEAISKAQVQSTYEVFLSLTQDVLVSIGQDKTQSILNRTLAKAMLGAKGFENIEKMLDRAHGKPMITQEVKLEKTAEITDEELEARAKAYEKRNNKI